MRRPPSGLGLSHPRRPPSYRQGPEKQSLAQIINDLPIDSSRHFSCKNGLPCIPEAFTSVNPRYNLPTYETVTSYINRSICNTDHRHLSFASAVIWLSDLNCTKTPRQKLCQNEVSICSLSEKGRKAYSRHKLNQGQTAPPREKLPQENPRPLPQPQSAIILHQRPVTRPEHQR